MVAQVEAWNGQLAASGETRMDCGWRLAKLAWRLLRHNRNLLVLGLGFAVCAGSGSLALLCFLQLGALPTALAIACLASLAGVFLNVALAQAADDALDEQRMTVGEALAEASERLTAVAGWTAIAVAAQLALFLLLEVLPERGDFPLTLASGAWSFAIFFVVPTLSLNPVSPLEALRESLALLRQRWGEAFAGCFGIGAVTGLASIPAAILLAAGHSRNEVAAGSGDLAVGLGVAGLLILFVLGAATFQVFAVALYRDATFGYPSAHDYVELRPRRKSWVVRIGLSILALMLVLGAIGTILGPGPDPNESKVAFPASYAPWITAGMPVVHEGQEIGEVTATEISGGRDVVSFVVEPDYRHLKGSSAITISEFEGRPCLLVVPRDRRAPPPGLQPNAGAA